jgi:nucleoside-diphosphate-sugar epimerase
MKTNSPAHPQPTVLVTGATGAVGPHVLAALQGAGYGVRALVRRPPAPGLWPGAVQPCPGDITDAVAVEAALHGCCAAVHLAALLHIPNPSPALRGEYERVNVQGTAHLMAAAARQGVARVVFGSTVAVYGPTGPIPLNEDAPLRPDTVYGQTKLAAEALVCQAQRADGAPLGVILRLGAVYGARVKGNYGRLLRALARGRFLPIGSGQNRRTLIYDRDVAAAVVLALGHPQAAGRIYNVSDGELHSLQSIITAMCHALGRRPPAVSLPVRPLRWALGCAERGARLLGRQAPVGPATLDKYLEETVVCAGRIQTELGFRPQVDLRTGWCETVAELRQSGQL